MFIYQNFCNRNIEDKILLMHEKTWEIQLYIAQISCLYDVCSLRIVPCKGREIIFMCSIFLKCRVSTIFCIKIISLPVSQFHGWMQFSSSSQTTNKKWIIGAYINMMKMYISNIDSIQGIYITLLFQWWSDGHFRIVQIKLWKVERPHISKRTRFIGQTLKCTSKS